MMRKRRVIAIISALISSLIIILCCVLYFNFVTHTIYSESSAHLKEIYHQVYQSFDRLIDNTWSSLHTYEPYLSETTDNDKKIKYIENLKEEGHFTEFYFLDGNGKYMNIEGRSGYLDFKGKLEDLVVGDNDVVLYSIVGNSEITLFGVPASGNISIPNNGTEVNFTYEAIAISFDDHDLVSTLSLQAYESSATSLVVRRDGRVLFDNAPSSFPHINNFIAALKKDSNLSEAQIDAITEDLQTGKSGDAQLKLNGVSYYLVYQSVDFEDWMLLGIVPSSIVNKSMNDLQIYSLLVVSSIALVLIFGIGAIIFYRYHKGMMVKDSELKYREELFSILSNNTNDIFIMLNAKDMHVDYLSPNIERLVGISASECRKNIRIIDRLVRDKETVLIFDQLNDMKPGEQKSWNREYVHQTSGEEKWFYVVALCRDFSGQKKFIVALSDRTKEKEVNQSLKEAVAVAESANKAKSAFLSSMSHDIRTPMNAIIGYTTLAATDISNKEKVKDYLSKILSSGNHLLSLINDILDMSRIENGKIRLEENEVNLSELLHDIKTIIGGQIHAKRLDLFMDVIDVVDENVYCDKTRINQVLLNLLSNAIKFTPSGGMIAIRVSELPCSIEGMGNFEFRVKDNGIGISEDFLKNVFEPFERERSSTVSGIQGTGLGMAITKNIVTMMGGTIEVESKEGVGTEFIINLTLRLQDKRETLLKIKELEGLKALVVDDDYNTCDSVTKMLVQVGMRPEWTLSGKEAVLRAKQSIELDDKFRAYIIDWSMPDVNGLEVVRQIRSLGDDTPIIIMTAYDWQDIEEEALKAGVTTFCSKPIFMSDLRDSLYSAIGQNKKEKEISLFSLEDVLLFKGRRVLLVEDNEFNREITGELLSNYSFDVDFAANGKEAVEKVESSAELPYDVILMDIQMPIMNGYEATSAIRKLENEKLKNIPIIAMTANAFEEDKKAALDYGMNDFLSKPVNMKEFVTALKNLFESKE